MPYTDTTRFNAQSLTLDPGQHGQLREIFEYARLARQMQFALTREF